MGKTYSKMTLPKSTPRQPAALAAKMRGAATMKHRNQPRGGARNEQADLLDEVEENYYDQLYADDSI